MGYAAYLQNLKDNDTKVFDKLSYADFSVAAAFTTIQEAGGPVMLEDFAYGRADVESESQAGNAEGVPSANNYVSRLESLGLSTEEIVAVANIESFGVHEDPNHSRWSSHPKFDNYFYKSLVTQSGNDHPLHDALMGNADTKA